MDASSPVYDQNFFLDLARPKADTDEARAAARDEWNAWRRKPENADVAVTFEGVDFRLPENVEISFAGFEFGNGADFRNARFGSRADFCGAKFGYEASFDRSIFAISANFFGTQFDYNLRFYDAEFIGGAIFHARPSATWLNLAAPFSGAAYCLIELCFLQARCLAM